MFVPLITVKVDGNDFSKLPRDNRYKRSIENDDVDGDDGGAVQSTPRQRRIRKFIRKLPNNLKTNNSIINDNNNNNDNTRSDSDINRPRNDNTQPKEIINEKVETPQIKPTRRRIVVPIRRTRLRLAEPQLPSTTPAAIPAPKAAPKRKMVIMRRRLAPKSPTPAPIVSTILDVVTRPTTKLRTLTFVVTRVHDGHSETISSTSVREQINTITETITRTQTIDASAVESTPTTTAATPTQSL